ncbi:short chain dehydrogenase reductase family oxidoreductase [Fusarium albosuccineum]|uniref:Short chain dehydrogenase reductase family oxidoreductase n=1 Tax=Fusarium albosuccineum TaxID=1237068 RepID=A0A8H4L8F8_9HYPO|nr:short chain dehydrogenase reductase family oxidoreductase [Fusarium albosuccineum]
MAGFWDFARAQRSTLPLVPTKATTTGKTFIVTGVNIGLGFKAAKHLVILGAKRVILGVRSLEKGNAVVEAIAKAIGRSNAYEVWQLNLALLASVESFAMKL